MKTSDIMVRLQSAHIWYDFMEHEIEFSYRLDVKQCFLNPSNGNHIQLFKE